MIKGRSDLYRCVMSDGNSSDEVHWCHYDFLTLYPGHSDNNNKKKIKMF